MASHMVSFLGRPRASIEWESKHYRWNMDLAMENPPFISIYSWSSHWNLQFLCGFCHIFIPRNMLDWWPFPNMTTVHSPTFGWNVLPKPMAQTGCVKPARHGSDRYHPASQLIESKWRSRSRRCRQVVAAKLRHQNVVDHGMTGCCGFITTLWLCQQFAMENGSVEIVSFPIKMVIFHSYVKLPEGKPIRINMDFCKSPTINCGANILFRG